jgi:hypothetical protein
MSKSCCKQRSRTIRMTGTSPLLLKLAVVDRCRFPRRPRPMASRPVVRASAKSRSFTEMVSML